MKVVIFCGGHGTRLREETEFKPKPLVEVGGMPIIWHIMKIYSHYGFNEFILPLGYKGELIKDFFIHFNWRANHFTLDFLDSSIKVHQNHKNEDWKIHFVDTGMETKTALRLQKVKDILKDDDQFMLTYGDGVADIDIKKLLDFHKKQKRVVTITGVKTRSRFGTLDINENTLREFNEKPILHSHINAGFMVANSEIFDHISDEDIMLEADDGPLSKLAKKQQVAVYHHDGQWQCMDTYRDYMNLNKLWKKSPFWKVWKKK